MSRPSSRIELPALRSKFQVLCARQGWSMAELARRLNVSASTLSEYQCGVEGHPSKMPDTLPRDKLERLAALLRGVAPCALSTEEALAAWRWPDASRLSRWLDGQQAIRLAELLTEPRRQLLVQAHVVPRQERAALADMAFDDRPTHDVAVQVSHQFTAVRFVVMAEPGARLFVACATEQGWHQLVPGQRHDGLVKSPCEPVPPAARLPLAFAPPLGRHRFVFIQAKVPLLQARAPALGLREPLGEADVAELQRRLGEAPPGIPWVWGEALVDVA